MIYLYTQMFSHAYKRCCLTCFRKNIHHNLMFQRIHQLLKPPQQAFAEGKSVTPSFSQLLGFIPTCCLILWAERQKGNDQQCGGEDLIFTQQFTPIFDDSIRAYPCWLPSHSCCLLVKPCWLPIHISFLLGKPTVCWWVKISFFLMKTIFDDCLSCLSQFFFIGLYWLIMFIPVFFIGLYWFIMFIPVFLLVYIGLSWNPMFFVVFIGYFYIIGTI